MELILLQFWFIEIYMWSVVISTMIFIMGSFTLANSVMDKKGIDGLMQSNAEAKTNGFMDKVVQSPFILFVIPGVNLLVSIIMIIMVAVLGLHKRGKIKFDLVDQMTNKKEDQDK